jgi:hypothetical protein
MDTRLATAADLIARAAALESILGPEPSLVASPVWARALRHLSLKRPLGWVLVVIGFLPVLALERPTLELFLVGVFIFAPAIAVGHIAALCVPPVAEVARNQEARALWTRNRKMIEDLKRQAFDATGGGV